MMLATLVFKDFLRVLSKTSCDFTSGGQKSGLLCANNRQESALSSPYHCVFAL